jgi:hypothetical protein
MDFAAWLRLHRRTLVNLDPRNNTPRIGRVLIAAMRRWAISNSFGPSYLAGFTVWTDQVT